MLVAQRVFKVVRTDLHEKYDHPDTERLTTDAQAIVRLVAGPFAL